ncbi:MAG: TetR/AcrR family transcriptional regulator [Methylobacter sp.]|nr:MAG: TetR/AcrR family transcriptional regulator [Methylobacter sp.]
MEKEISDPTLTVSGQRGPASHERRIQIIKSAHEHFLQYGYKKTSVADLAKAIGVSSAYIYRFFESKQAIGEAICSVVLGKFVVALHELASSDMSASNRLRKLYITLLDMSLEMFFNERKLHDITIAAVEERWCTTTQYHQTKYEVITKIIQDGRASGEFERKTPLDEVVMAIVETLYPFSHPILLQHPILLEQSEPEVLHQRAIAVSNLVLRSLAP